MKQTNIYLRSIRELSFKIDYIFLELMKLFKNNKDRIKIFRVLNDDDINIYTEWKNLKIPRMPKFMIRNVKIGSKKFEKWDKKNRKDEYIKFYEEVFGLQLNGINLYHQILNEIEKEEYESKKLSGYYFAISLPYFLVLVKQKSISTHTLYELLYETLNKRVITLKIFKIIYHLCENVLGVKMLPITSYQNKLIKESEEIKKKLDELITSKSPGYLEAKNKGYYKIDPLDKNIGTMEGLIKLLNENKFNFIYFKKCERQGCNHAILKNKFLRNKKKRGPYDKYCNDCKQKQRREKTRIRVKRYREKIKMAA